MRKIVSLVFIWASTHILYHQAHSELSKNSQNYQKSLRIYKTNASDARIWDVYQMRAYVFFHIQSFMSIFAEENQNQNGQRPF